MKTHETYKMQFTQKGTNRKATLTVEAPLGMPFEEAYKAVLEGKTGDMQVVVK